MSRNGKHSRTSGHRACVVLNTMAKGLDATQAFTLAAEKAPADAERNTAEASADAATMILTEFDLEGEPHTKRRQEALRLQ